MRTFYDFDYHPTDDVILQFQGNAIRIAHSIVAVIP